MPRKNSRAGTRNTSKAARRALADIPKMPRHKYNHPTENLVVPDGQCSFKSRRPKARFATEEKAAQALKQAQKKREAVGSGNVEKRYYACPEGGCGGYHLTSREEYRPRGGNQGATQQTVSRHSSTPDPP